MWMWKCLLVLSCIAIAVPEEFPELPPGVQIDSVKIQPTPENDISFLKPYLEINLKELLKQDDDLRNILEDILKADRKGQTAIVNEFADQLFENLNIFLNDIGVDPLPLPGFEENFRWTVFVGWVSLDNGFLRGVTTLKRNGDVVVGYEYPFLTLTAPVGFSKLSFDYDYEAKFMGLGPSGKAEGAVEETKFTIKLDMDLTRIRIYLTKFKLNKLGKLSIDFTGGLVAEMVNVLSSVVLAVLKPLIKGVLEDFITVGLTIACDMFNNFMCTILDDCTTSAAIARILY